MKKTLSVLSLLMLAVMWMWVWLWVHAEEPVDNEFDWLNVKDFAEESDWVPAKTSESNVWNDENLELDWDLSDSEAEDLENSLPIENESYATPEDVKSVDTWVELNIAIALLVVAWLSAYWYRKAMNK